jgi:membrane protease YdiL (CAAX protease family)
MLLFAAVVYAPLTEEILFRGAFYGHLRQRLRPFISAAIVSIVFAAIHPQGLAGIPPLAALAFSFALIREWRGSLIGPVFAHALNNGVATVVILLLLR